MRQALRSISTAVLLLCVLLSGCGQTGGKKPAPTPELGPGTPVPLSYAKGFALEKHGVYTALTVYKPGTQEAAYRYVFVPRGKPEPKVEEGVQVLTVPLRRVVCFYTTHIGMLSRLNAIDRVAGFANNDLLNNPALLSRAAQNNLPEIGDGNKLNIERVVMLAPDAALIGFPMSGESDPSPRLKQGGLHTVVIAEFLEQHPLGQAEWIKVFGVLFDLEKEAGAVFSDSAKKYEALTEAATKLPNKPSVLLGSSFQGTWAVPSGRGFTAQLIHDAGGAYLWADTEYKGNMPLNVEQVVTKGLDADFWLNPGTAKSLDELKQSDERYANFRAFKEGRVFNQNRVLNAKGGNDFWETGLAYPEKILEDMVRIFHPELLPANGEFHWYRKLQ